jgi:energy-coupling factor transport system substrate-specific component
MTTATVLRPVVPMTRRSTLVFAVVSLVGLAAFGWPLLIGHGAAGNLSHSGDAPWILAAMLPLLLALFVAELGDGSLDAKAIAMLGVLSAAGAAMRLPTGGIAGFEMIFFLLLPAGRVFGRAFGFLVGAVTLFASAIITGGIGPWLPFQMLGAGWVGFGAGCLPAAVTGGAEVAMLAAYGALAGLLYGALLNLWFWPFILDSTSRVAFVPGGGVLDNLRRFWAFHLTTSLGWDVPRAVTTVVLVVVLGRPVLGALRRASTRASFGSSVEFVAHRTDRPVSAPAPGAPAPGGS